MPGSPTPSTSIPFTVDSALLRELGERLVGKPYIALAELVKNSYDADAKKVVIEIGEDSITVEDNGHGMTFEEFRDRWMRVGSVHKVAERRSRDLGRPLTGSKGIGRLATQFLATKLSMSSIPNAKTPKELTVLVDWASAVTAGDLTRASALYGQDPPTTTFVDGCPHGTKVTLDGLKYQWTTTEFEQIARELWFLQPPFRQADMGDVAEGAFEVVLRSPDPEIVTAFETQMSRILDIWKSRLVGRLSHGDDGAATIRLAAQIEDFPLQSVEHQIADPPLIEELEFEIRIFDLVSRQPYGISVGEARKYLNEYGGVDIYDAGFRIPYSGPEADWLRIEFDHAHRLSASALLPKELQVSEGMYNLPTTSRLWGVVHINTSREARAAEQRSHTAGDHLEIQVSRDRLVDNRAFAQLRDTVRWAIDYYAMRVTALRFEKTVALREVLPPAEAVRGMAMVLDRYSHEIPEVARRELEREVDTAILAVRSETETVHAQVGLLSALATAGITALAYDHQIIKQFHVLESLVDKLESAGESSDGISGLDITVAQIREWLDLARETHGLFRHLADESNREENVRYPASNLLSSLVRDMRGLLRGIDVDPSRIHPSIRLPFGTFAEWTSLFQNVLLNASNAMLNSTSKRIAVGSRVSGQRRVLRIQDTGVGVNLGTASQLFEPFHRELDIPADRRSLGYGGSGLGLTIVRMIANSLGCDVGFVKPDAQYATCFQVSWREES